MHTTAAKKLHDTFLPTLERAAQFTNEHPEIIKSVSRYPQYNDELKIFNYSAIYASNHKGINSAGGYSFEKEKALMRVLGESIERYCLDNYKAQIIFTGKENDIKEDHLKPLVMTRFSNN